MPPSVPSTRPMRRRTTRVPSRSAFLAAHSQASQTRWPKQRLPPSNSVSDSSCQLPYQPMAEPLINTAGRRSRRAIRRTTARVMRSRDARMRRRLPRVHNALAIGSPAKLMTASIAVSLAIWSRLVTSRNGGRRPAALAGSRASTVTSWPALTSASTSRGPMKPVAPVISTRCRPESAPTSSAALPRTSRSARRAAKKSRRPNTITPSAASGASTLPMPYQTGTIALGSPAQPARTGTSSARMAP